MKKEVWDLRKSIIVDWIDNIPSDNTSVSQQLEAIMLSLTLGDSCNSDELRSSYWAAIRSIGSCLGGFPEQFKYKPRGPTAGSILRTEFREKLHKVSHNIKDSGRVIISEGSPSLENLRVNAEFCNNDEGIEKGKRVRNICAEYNLANENVHITFKDCSSKKPNGRRSRYEGGSRSGAYKGRFQWPI